MDPESYATYREIRSQTEAWAEATEVMRAATLMNASDYREVLFTGCGSTYYLSLAAAALYQEMTGCSARAVPGSELLLNSSSFLTDQRTLLVALSRSGATTETVRAAAQFQREKRGMVLAISNYDDALGRAADMQVVIPKGQEESVAQTRSFASLLVAVCALSMRMARRAELLQAMTRLPAIGLRLMDEYEAAAQGLGQNLNLDRFYFLGSGVRYGLACEANLKMKEMTLTHSEPFHFMEFRHGPMSMVNPNAVVVGLLSEANLSHERAVLNEMRQLGGRVFALGEAKADVNFASGLPECLRPVLYLPVLQLMAFHRSVAKGLNPDRPKNLTAVVELDL